MTLFAVSTTGMIAGWWLLILVVAAFAAPAVILRSPTGATTISHERPENVTNERHRVPPDLGGIDVSRWENEGGAARRHVNGGVFASARAAR